MVESFLSLAAQSESCVPLYSYGFVVANIDRYLKRDMVVKEIRNNCAASFWELRQDEIHYAARYSDPHVLLGMYDAFLRSLPLQKSLPWEGGKGYVGGSRGPCTSSFSGCAHIVSCTSAVCSLV